MRLWPRSLFGRFVLVLSLGLVLAQCLSAWVHWSERDRLMLRAAGLQPLQRVVETVQLLDPMARPERARIVALLDLPPQRIRLDDAPPALPAPEDGGSTHLKLFSTMLQAALGDDFPLRVSLRDGPLDPDELRMRRRHEAMMQGLDVPLHRPPPGPVPATRFSVQVRLHDGQWVSFDSAVSREGSGLPTRLLITLALLLLGVLGLSWLAMRWVSRPLQRLAAAAESLGRNIRSTPLAEDGPDEVRQAAQAFNTMQARLLSHIDQRTRVLTAMSHDLKTPLTRLRLRAELMDDDSLRQRFEQDLLEMEHMVGEALAALRGMDEPAQSVPIDLNALLARLCADNLEMGRQVQRVGQVQAPLTGDPARLRRCLGNLIDNAVLYGQRASVTVEEGAEAVTIRVADEGPGIPDDLLEQVFEPFYRLEASRNRATGGSGLGLGIARDIARAMGGELSLHNRPEGGLEARLVWPRR